MKTIRTSLRPAAGLLGLAFAASWLFAVGRPGSGGTAVEAAAAVMTPAEAAGFKKYSQNEDIAAFLSRLQAASSNLAVRIAGRTRAVEGYDPRDIFLCILSETGAASPDALDRSRPTVLYTASQHGNEQSAKEAALALVRDLAAGELRPLLRRVNVLVIPQANPFGNARDTRVNEDDLDLNRDHVKLEAAETRAVRRVFRDWFPEVTLDVHEKGDDYYRVSVGCVSNANIAASLQSFSRRAVLAEIGKSLADRRIAFHEYLITEEMGSTEAAGVADRPGEGAAREIMMRYSTTDLNDGRNAPGIYETLSFIQEGASRHDLATLADRTRWQHAGLRAFLESVAGHGTEVLELVRSHRRRLLERAAAAGDGDPVHLRMVFARDPGEPELRLKRFARSESPVRGLLRRDMKAGEPVTAADLAPVAAPPGLKVEDEVVRNWFPLVKPTVSVERPLGYVIRGDRAAVVETLLDHGIRVELVVRDRTVPVEVYRVGPVVPAADDYLAPASIEVAAQPLLALVSRGDFFVTAVQEASNLVTCLLEPQSEFGLIRYWKYGLVPREGDVFPFYRVTAETGLEVVPYKRWPR